MAQKKLDDIQNSIGNFAQKMDSNEVNVGGKKFTGLQAIMIVAAIINIIGCFLPFIEASVSVAGSSGSSATSYISSHGFFSIILVIATCALSFIGKKLYAIISAALNFLLIIYDCFISASASAGAGSVHAEVSLKFGAYLILLGGLAVLVMSLFTFLLNRNK